MTELNRRMVITIYDPSTIINAVTRNDFSNSTPIFLGGAKWKILSWVLNNTDNKLTLKLIQIK